MSHNSYQTRYKEKPTKKASKSSLPLLAIPATIRIAIEANKRQYKELEFQLDNPVQGISIRSIEREIDRLRSVSVGLTIKLQESILMREEA